MGQITLQIPQTGSLNSTEDPKIASDFGVLQTLVNGNIEDSNIKTPNNAVRRVLLQAHGLLNSTTQVNVFDVLLGSPSMGTGVAYNSGPGVPFWAADSGLSSQPQDFQVPNLTARARVRMTMSVGGSVAPGMTFTGGLYQLTSVFGGNNAVGVQYSTTQVSGSTITFATPSTSTFYPAESGEFTLPTSGLYALGLKLSANMASNSAIMVTMQLLGYNS